RQRIVVLAQPAHKVEDIGVPPHPGRETLKLAEGAIRVRIGAARFYITIHAVCIGPIGFGSDGLEAVVANEPLGQLRATSVELVRAMGSFTQQHQPRFARVLQQRSEGIATGGRGASVIANNGNGLIMGRHDSGQAARRSRVRERASNSCTSSSLVWSKISYHWPTAKKGVGVAAQTTSSAISCSASQVCRAATGTATMIRAGRCWRTAATALRMLAPVARPSSTRMTILS